MDVELVDASPYHDVKNVQMIASPLFNVPVPIPPPYDTHPLPDDFKQRRYHDFSLEHRIVQEYQRIMAEEAAVMEAKESAYRLYSEERQARLKQERINRARKIAPGFLDNEDRRILTPTLATSQVKDASVANEGSKAFSEKNNHIDYSEFEFSDGPSGEVTGAVKESIEDEQQLHQQQQQQQQADSNYTSSSQDYHQEAGDVVEEEEIIIQAVPLSTITGMLRDSCLDEDVSSPGPRAWTERDAASEKTSVPSFNATARLDFREFEQGLGPPDPWDTPVDDLTALKDVISQQMGHSSSSQSQQVQQQQQQYQQHQQQQQTSYLYQQQTQQQQQQQQQQPQVSNSFQQQNADQQMLNQYPYNSTPNRTGFNSSPLPVASYVPQPKLTGIAQQQQALQHHQQQHQQQRHSTGSTIGSPLSNTGMTAAQQQARFGAASPSPPPLPPPPRALTSSPGLGTGTPTSTVTVGGGGAAGGLNRPPVPARPGRPSDQADLATSGGGSADHVTTMERTMTPPRPPLPPPPPGSQGAGGNGIVSSSATSSSIPVSSGAATSVGGQLPSSLGVGGPTSATASRPALKPRPPKEHEILQGIIGTKKTPA
ncbi:hypothetical protein BGZ80_004440, partial [Entomortierella chlamydospora]